MKDLRIENTVFNPFSLVLCRKDKYEASLFGVTKGGRRDFAFLFHKAA